MSDLHAHDVLIIGSGLAGLTVALSLANEKRVAIVTKRALIEGASDWAQGGIAAVLDQDEDNFADHIQDTLIAGAGLCDENAVRYIVENGPSSIRWLIEQGVPFTPDASSKTGYHLTREGGHSHRRIIHADDATGHAVQTTLEAKVRAHPNITLFESHHVVNLITTAKLAKWEGGNEQAITDNHCVGAYVFNKATQQVETFTAPFVVLATGGAGKVYLYTSNPDTATGDGIAMAWRVGCRVANMEFIQFHPTCLYHPHAKSFLITEAVRGEGGKLLLPDGSRFMPSHDKREELAPRDVVARAIDYEMKKRGLDCVYLDITHQPAKFILSHFPNIYATCKELGIDMTHEPIPVVPAAHYTCGGVLTDLHARTDITGLYAVGEVACTGLHGANRLASNSLLECLVMGKAAAADILTRPTQTIPSIPQWDESRVTRAEEEVTVSHDWDELRRLMWNYVGIVRSNQRLAQAQRRISLLKEEVDEFYNRYLISPDLLELRNLTTVADLIVQSAVQRKESRGLHYTKDFPNKEASPSFTILHRH
ncbi:L-aspartate oxidase [Parvibium lacunae]|uniref:L-aspartate oxidase n=1 Tax=Parvibium lacunae TaxID=1888893 RepID=A0A368L3G6_9BURK|nr:L-aspartate oxidase [Parvibium lacunae]RCS58131.1 L-aspartate oxidase [Parvibium lacunae]